MRVPAGIFGRVVVSFSLGIALVAGAGLAPVAAEEAPPVSVAVPGSEEAAQAQAAESGQDVVVDDATTPTGVSTAHPDGTFTRTEHVEPVRMETSTGWKDISTDLVPVMEGGREVLKPEMVPVDVSLGTAGTRDMAVLDDGQGHSITQSWPFGTLPAPVVLENTATYPGVLPGVDLIQVVHPTGVSQVLRIATAAAAHDPRVAAMRIFLDARNATVTATGDGGLQATGDDSGQVELRTAAGQWWDSSQEGASATDPGNPGLTWPFKLSLGQEGDQDTQLFGMDEILDRPGIIYPIFVDPDWTYPRASYVYVDDGYPTTSYWNGQYADGTGHVGFLPAAWGDGRDHKTRTFFQFSTSLTTGKVILKARMDTWLQWSSSCTATPVTAWQVSGISSATTWNNKPNLENKANTQTVSKGNSACLSPQPQGTVAFDLATIKNEIPKYSSLTVGLLAGNETDPLGWKKFSNNPTLAVTYGTPPATPTIYTISGGLWDGTAWGAQSRYVTRDNTPVYTVRASDPDGASGGNITVTMKTKNAAGAVVQTGPAISGSPAAGTMFAWQGGTLPDGNYILEAQTKDQQGLLSGVMSFAFTVEMPPPPRPEVTVSTAGSFIPVQGRLVDSKIGMGVAKAPLAPSTPRTVQVTGAAGIPAEGVSAVLLTMTSTDPTAAGQMSAGPADGALAGVMRYGAGGYTSNSAVVMVSDDGKINIQTTTTTNLLMDVQGYYTFDHGNVVANAYSPVTQTRIVDTSNGIGLPNAKLAGGSTSTIQVTGKASVPTGAKAAFVHFQINNTNSVPGFINPYATNATSRPEMSLNFGGRPVTSIGAIVPLADDGTIKVFLSTGNTIDLLVDVEGYFTPGGSNSSAGVFTPAVAKIHDTQLTSRIAPGATVTIPIGGTNNIPTVADGVSAITANLTVVDTGTAGGYARAYASGTTEPTNASTLTFSAGTAGTYTTNLATIPRAPDMAI